MWLPSLESVLLVVSVAGQAIMHTEAWVHRRMSNERTLADRIKRMSEIVGKLDEEVSAINVEGSRRHTSYTKAINDLTSDVRELKTAALMNDRRITRLEAQHDAHQHFSGV